MDPRLGDPAQYENLLRHALAIGGVTAAGFSALDSVTGRLQPVAHAESVAPEILEAVRAVQGIDPEFSLSLLTCPTATSPFVERVLASDQLVDGDVGSIVAGVIPADTYEAFQKRLHIDRVVGGRVEAAADEVGIVVFALDAEPRPAALAFLDSLTRRIRRAMETSATRPDSGRTRLRQQVDAALGLAETAAAASQVDLDTLLHRIVEWLRAALDADVATILLLDDDGRLAPRANVQSDAAKEAGLGERLDRMWPRNRGLTGWVAETQQPAISPNVLEDPRSSPRSGRPPEAVIAAPIMSGGRAIGVLRGGSSRLGHFKEPDLALIEILARECAIAIEQARMIQTLREQNDRLALFARVIDSSHDAMVIADPEGRIQYCNSATYSLYGYEPGELIGTLATNLTPAENQHAVDEMRAAFAHHEDWGSEVRQVRKDGTRFPADLSVSRVLNDEHRTIGTIALVRDLTQRKQHEAQLLQAEKLRSLGVLASGVAHQINNVLASVLGHAELLLDRASDPATRRQLELIMKASEDGATAVRRIQEFAQAKPKQRFVSVDVTAIVQDVISATAPRWRDQAQRQGRSITVGASATGPAYTLGDPAELREAFSNLVLNAVDAIQLNGSVDLAIDGSSDPIAIIVQDTGQGMPDDVLQHAYDPFFTTKPLGSGVGLGLSLTHTIIQRHGGSISATSQVGQGTTFKVLLPRGEAPTVEASPTTGEKVSNLRVLVVDDEPDLAEQLEIILAMDGHQVQVCHGGAEALTALDERDFDLVITDLGMPDIGGWDVAREAKARQPGVQVALLTGWANELEGTQELHERGLDFVVTKPYRMQAIHDLVASASQAASSSS